MTLGELLKIANTHYPDGWVLKHWDPEANQPLGESQGDTLALFVVRELDENYDPFAGDEEQLAVAIGLIGRAIGDLLEVHRGLVEGLRKRIDTRRGPPSVG